MPQPRTIRKDNFAVNLLPIEFEKDGVRQTTGINRLISASEIAAAQAKLVISGNEDEVPIYMIGDMHGNALKLLAVLGLTGAVRLQPESYKAWADLYESIIPATDYLGEIWFNHPERLDEARTIITRLTKRPENFQDQIKRILDKLTWNPDFKGQIVLLGDVLHDRGHSDFMTLLLMERMHQKKLRYTYCLGNHDQGVLLRYTWPQKGMSYGSEQFFSGGKRSDPQFSGSLMATSPSDTQSYDYRVLNAKQQKLFIKAYEVVLRHAKLFEHFCVGDDIVVASHCVFLPSLLPSLSRELKTILRLKNTDETRDPSPELIDDINRLLQVAIFDKKYWAALTRALGDYHTTLHQTLSHRGTVEIAHVNHNWTPAWLKEQYTTGDWKRFYCVYGHDLDGGMSHLGKVNPSTVKRNPDQTDVFLCLDTMIGRPKLSALYNAVAAWATYKKLREPLAEDISGSYEGDLLVCSIKPEVKDPEQKLVQTQKAVINGLLAYENWYKHLDTAVARTPAFEQERKIALMMMNDVVDAQSPSAVRLVLQDFAKDIYGAKLAEHSTLKDHRNNLLSYLLDSINAAYPPLSLAVKLGSAEAGSHSFTLDYPELPDTPSENARLAKIKSEAFLKMKQIGVKAQSERSGIDVATLKANASATRPSSGGRRIVDFFRPKS